MTSSSLTPLSERSERMLGYVPPWLANDTDEQAFMRAAGEELDAIEAFMVLIRQQAWPHMADDTYGLLSIHEQTLGIDQDMIGTATIADRQALVRSRMQGRRDGRKSKWAERVDALIGVGNWDYAENTPGPHQITITLHIEETIGLADRVKQLIEAFTPVVDEVIIAFSGGFLLGVSPLGEVAL